VLTANRTSLQPLYGQLSNVFGRRWPTIFAAAAFTMGSGICGGASSMGMLIAGRVVQGIGAGGINVLIEIVVCDLIPLRQRGQYLAIMFGLVAIGTALGPFFGGLIVQYSTWRWVFYLNLPVGGVALLLLILFLNVKYKKEPTFSMSLGKIDWIGNVVFIASISAILIALSWAGAVHPWSSIQVLVPLILGILGLAGFLVLEKFVAEPMMPLRLLSNRTSLTAYILTFFHSIVTMWALYFLPVYFQGVKQYSSGYAGVALLPTILILVPTAAAGGGIMSKTGRYRPIHHIGYALMTIGSGLFTLLGEGSSIGDWVGFQILNSAGAGLIIPTLLPAVLAPLTDADTALATATWAFLRSFGLTWGTAIPAAIFNNRVEELAGHITDPAAQHDVTGGRAYEHAVKVYVDALDSVTRPQFVGVLVDGLRRTWEVSIAFAALGFLLVILQKEVPLRSKLDTEFGMEDKKKISDAESAAKATG
jgi:MFS family permease